VGLPPFPFFDKKQGEVDVPPFYLDRTEVPNGAYARFVRETGRGAPASWAGGVPPPGGENLPVVGVTWDDARSYAEWAGKRLPTELEWEVACRGPEGFRYSWGDEFVADRARVPEPIVVSPGTTIERRPSLGPVPVDSVSPGRDTSPFGILHLVGNVREWVWDPWTPREPPPREAWWLSGTGERVYRGSSWRIPSSEFRCQCSSRNHARPDYSSDDLGFRCAKSATL
jgi:formylglycine-generating enzyme required for sulfatase activity